MLLFLPLGSLEASGPKCSTQQEKPESSKSRMGPGQRISGNEFFLPASEISRVAGIMGEGKMVKTPLLLLGILHFCNSPKKYRLPPTGFLVINEQ